MTVGDEVAAMVGDAVAAFGQVDEAAFVTGHTLQVDGGVPLV
jgi:NAD(P)-dependent dehydrogenase (short-subunit alcohol dehydrogenase family)